MMRRLAIVLLMGCKSDPGGDAPKVAVTVVPAVDAAAPESSSVATDSAVPEASVPPGPLKKRDFATVMARRTLQLRKVCLEPNGATAADCVTLEIRVDPGGTASRVMVLKSGPPLVTSCLMTRVRTFRFPASEEGGTFPFSICGP
jgi:hypothetical protein